jgi:4a-hydroxytetrahydrobiopterin dehydratase
MLALKERKCLPSNKLDKALETEELKKLQKQLLTEWIIEDDKKLKKTFPFESFKRAMAFVQEIGLVAENENHHPDICIHYTSAEIVLTTHDLGGLSVNDFIMAAKIEAL